MSLLSAVGPIFRAVVCTVVPEAEGLDEQGWHEVETLVEGTLRERAPAMVRQLRTFLRVIEWCSVFRYGRRFTALGSEGRKGVLSYLQNHRVEVIRSGFWGLRTLAFLGFYCRPEATRAIGYRPDARGWGALR